MKIVEIFTNSESLLFLYFREVIAHLLKSGIKRVNCINQVGQQLTLIIQQFLQ